MSIINEKYFKEYSPVPLNYNMKELNNYIKVAQEIWVRPLIGSDLLDEIEEQVKNNTVSKENATLLTDGGLWQYLSYSTCLEGLPFLWAHISEVGITKGKSDNSDSLDLKDMTYMSQHLRSQVEARKDYCKKWLCQRFEYFPDLDVCGCGCDCCNNSASLKNPNPNYMVYKPIKKNTNLR